MSMFSFPKRRWSGTTPRVAASPGRYWIDPPAKLKILTLDGPPRRVIAQFNPKEIQIDQSLNYSPEPTSESANLQYTSRAPMSLSIELTFDGFESGTCVLGEIQTLIGMTRSMAAPDPKRPPKVRLIWTAGDAENGDSDGLENFNGVIESVGVKYTMFSERGVVLRATANLKIKEAGEVAVASEKSAAK